MSAMANALQLRGPSSESLCRRFSSRVLNGKRAKLWQLGSTNGRWLRLKREGMRDHRGQKRDEGIAEARSCGRGSVRGAVARSHRPTHLPAAI